MERHADVGEQTILVLPAEAADHDISDMRDELAACGAWLCSFGLEEVRIGLRFKV